MTAQHPFTYAWDTALVTGAASGSGQVTAAMLVSAGLTVLLLDRDGDGAIAAAELDMVAPLLHRGLIA
jgi:NADP-dependent 3-hydroxy acid dehydrogenase YdfG